MQIVRHDHEIRLPVFTGKKLDWFKFHQEFVVIIDSFHLSSTAKFLYLRDCLIGDVKLAIEGLPVSANSFEEALEILVQRYGDRTENIDAHVNAILDIQSPSINPESLLKFYDELQYHVRILQQLECSADSMSFVLLPVVKGKLPSEIRAQIFRTCNNPHDFATYRTALYQEILARGVGETFSCKVPTKMSTRKGPCAYCKTLGHSPLHCQEIMDPVQRLDIIRTDRLCFNCLGPHQMRHCRSDFSCRVCTGSHHTSLHESLCINTKPARTTQLHTKGGSQLHASFNGSRPRHEHTSPASEWTEEVPTVINTDTQDFTDDFFVEPAMDTLTLDSNQINDEVAISLIQDTDSHQSCSFSVKHPNADMTLDSDQGQCAQQPIESVTSVTQNLNSPLATSGELDVQDKIEVHSKLDSDRQSQISQKRPHSEKAQYLYIGVLNIICFIMILFFLMGTFQLQVGSSFLSQEAVVIAIMFTQSISKIRHCLKIKVNFHHSFKSFRSLLWNSN